eukprot:c49564_g1_i1 orf=1-510(-)
MILFLCFAIFTLEVTNEDTGHHVQGENFKEYSLSDYPKWLRLRVEDRHYWAKVVRCLKQSRHCNSTVLRCNGKRPDQAIVLSPFQSGCCKPPVACNFTCVSGSVWKNSTTPLGDSDCKTWSNDPSELCYYCESCRAGSIEASKDIWRRTSILNTMALMILMVLYALLACF